MENSLQAEWDKLHREKAELAALKEARKKLEDDRSAFEVKQEPARPQGKKAKAAPKAHPKPPPKDAESTRPVCLNHSPVTVTFLIFCLDTPVEAESYRSYHQNCERRTANTPCRRRRIGGQ